MRSEIKVIRRYIILLFALVSVACSSDDSVEPIGFELDVPVIMQVSNIGETSFKVNFSTVKLATGYELDIAIDKSFEDILSDYGARQISGPGFEVVGLQRGTTYYLRIRAFTLFEKSKDSEVVAATTKNISGNLRDEANFPIGVAVASTGLTGSRTRIDTLEKKFSGITAEYEMTMSEIFRGIKDYNWESADAIVDYALTINAQVHGHALIWDKSVPNWLIDFEGSNQEFEELVDQYIVEVMTRYKGRVASWDVVTEAIDDQPEHALRENIFKERMGEDYIRKCFDIAREVDPDALLFYNDINLSSNGSKLDSVLSMVDDLDDMVDGIGFQMHVDFSFPSRESLEKATAKVVAKGLMMNYSQVDVRVNTDGNQAALTTTRATAQKAQYKSITEVFLSVPDDQKMGITFWGLKDDETWLIDFWSQPDWPLLFDENLDAKPAYYGVLEALKEL